jgi:hypothetical protein
LDALPPGQHELFLRKYRVGVTCALDRTATPLT